MVIFAAILKKREFLLKIMTFLLLGLFFWQRLPRPLRRCLAFTAKSGVPRSFPLPLPNRNPGLNPLCINVAGTT